MAVLSFFYNVSNRSYSIINGVHTQYDYDHNDRLIQQGATHYTYDDNGNTLTETEEQDQTVYHYDSRNKLIHIEKTQTDQDGNTTSQSIRYQYNPDGIRNHTQTETQTDSTQTSHLVDSNRDYAQVIAELDQNNQVITEYLYGDDLISQQRQSNTHYYHYDGLGSTRYLTDQNGNLTDQYHYDAFGLLSSQVGITENDYLFAGEQYEQETGHYALRARDYDPGSGRFTQMDTWTGNNQDPITLHKYAYGNQDPVNRIGSSPELRIVSKI